MGEQVVDPGAWSLQGVSSASGSVDAAGVLPYEDAPAETTTLTIPATPTGVATALSHLSAAHRSMGPERSHPSYRGYPPLVELGRSAEIPASVRAATPETGIAFRLPAEFDYLYVAAPLAYYLGAEVTVGDRETPTLAAPSVGLVHRFDRLPAFQDAVADLFRRCFYMDVLVRDIGDELYGRSCTLSKLGLDRERLLAASAAERLRAYLSLPEGVDDHLPEWHLSTYVGPEPGRARSLPHLLDAMSLVYPPEASDLDRRERLERSLDDFYRSGAEAASVDVLKPTLQSGDLHAWLADGTPIDAYKTNHRALRNRLRYRETPGEWKVAVVCNDEEMAAEQAVAEIYREEAEDIPLDVTVHENLRRAELASVLETPHAFVHYIGHCDVEGLRCPDGNLAAADLDDVRTRTFFLNACGSYHEGLGLVKSGSTAGAVTLTSVLDEQAATVGTTFARLLANGFSIARALELARRRIMMGKDYAVVGDGTASVVRDATPATLYVTGEDEEFQVRYEAPATRAAGGCYREPFDGRTHLLGVASESTLDRERLTAFLEDCSLPVVHDGRFFWSTDLAAELEAT